MNGNDQKRERLPTSHEVEAIQWQIDKDMVLVERLLDRNGIAKDGDLRRILLQPLPQYTPEQVERIQQDFIQEVFRSLDPEARAVLRLTAAALPLSNTQESLRKELADTRERAARISSAIKERLERRHALSGRARRERC